MWQHLILVSGGAAYLLGLFFCDFFPFVGRRVLAIAVGQAEQVRLTPFGIAGAAWFGDFDKAEWR